MFLGFNDTDIVYHIAAKILKSPTILQTPPQISTYLRARPLNPTSPNQMFMAGRIAELLDIWGQDTNDLPPPVGYGIIPRPVALFVSKYSLCGVSWATQGPSTLNRCTAVATSAWHSL